jgi:hypothetical protein
LQPKEIFVFIGLEFEDVGVVLIINLLENGIEGKDNDIQFFQLCLAIGPTEMGFTLFILY